MRNVGSAACQNCHKSEHDRWKRALMANVVQDPKGRLRAENLRLTIRPRRSSNTVSSVSAVPMPMTIPPRN